MPKKKRMTLIDNETGRKATIDWYRSQPPSDADIAEIFSQQQARSKKAVQDVADKPLNLSPAEEFAVSPIGRGIGAVGDEVNKFGRGFFGAQGLPESPEQTAQMLDKATSEPPAPVSGIMPEIKKGLQEQWPQAVLGPAYGIGKGLYQGTVRGAQELGGGQVSRGAGTLTGTWLPWMGAAQEMFGGRGGSQQPPEPVEYPPQGLPPGGTGGPRRPIPLGEAPRPPGPPEGALAVRPPMTEPLGRPNVVMPPRGLPAPEQRLLPPGQPQIPGVRPPLQIAAPEPESFIGPTQGIGPVKPPESPATISDVHDIVQDQIKKSPELRVAAPEVPSERAASPEITSKPEGADLSYKEPMELQPAFTKTGKVKVGYGEELGEILSTSMYKGDPVKIIPKELLQNAFDAIRGVKGGEVHARAYRNYNEPKEQGKYGESYPGYVEIKDNGIGMTRDELGTLFVDLGSSGKRSQADASGGFGLAKAAPLLAGRYAKIVSTSGATGELLTSTMEGTPQDFLKGNVEIKTEKAAPGTTQGTTVTVKLPEKSYHWDAEDVIKNYGKSVRLPGKLFKAPDSEFGQPRDLAEPPPQDVLSESEVPGVAKVVMYKTPEVSSLLSENNLINVEINNNGLYQFSLSMNAGRAEGVPKRISVDIQSLVPEKNANYPFTSNREELRDVIKKHVTDTIQQEIIKPAQMRGTDIVQAKYDQFPEFPSGARFYDVGARLTPDETQEIMNHPDVQEIAKAVYDAIMESTEKLRNSTTYHEFKESPFGKVTDRSGLIFSDHVHGLHVPSPGSTVGGAGNKATTLINPFSFVPGTEPANIASGIWNTIKHEIVHDVVSQHYDRFALGEYELARALGAKDEIKWLTHFTRLYEGDTPGQLKESLQRPIQIYQDAIGRPASEADPFGGETLPRETPERLSGGDEEGPGTDLQRTGSGDVWQLGRELEPARLEPEPELPGDRTKKVSGFGSERGSIGERPLEPDDPNVQRVHSGARLPAHVFHGMMRSMDQFLEHNPVGKDIVRVIKNSYSKEEYFKYSAGEQYAKNVPKGSASPENQGPEWKAHMRMLWKMLDDAGIRTKDGKKISEVEGYFPRIKAHGTSVASVKQATKELFTKDGVKITPTEEETPEIGHTWTDYLDPRNRDVPKGLEEKNPDKLIRQYHDMVGRVVYAKKNAQLARLFLDDIKDPWDKYVARWYIDRYAGVAYHPLERLIRTPDRFLAGLSARSVLALSPALQELHAARILTHIFPELGPTYTTLGIVDFVKSPLKTIEEVRASGLTRNPHPRRLWTGTEKVDDMLQLFDIGNLLAKGVALKGAQRKLKATGDPNWAMDAPHEAARMEGFVNVTSPILFFERVPKFFFMFKYWIFKYGENAVIRNIEGIMNRDKEAMWRAGRYILGGVAAGYLAKKTGLALWHLRGESLVRLWGSPQQDTYVRTGQYLSNGQFDKAAEEIIRIMTPAGHSFTRRERRTGDLKVRLPKGFQPSIH